jgi:NADH-quinone oxidoreductase subunit M
MRGDSALPLSFLVWVPVGSALLGALLSRALAPRVAFGGALVTLGMAVGYVLLFDRGSPGLQFVTDETWIPQLGIHYKLGLDGLNLFLVLLTALLFAATLLAANLRDWERPRLFYFHLGLAETGVLGAFCAQDLALFIAFFDLMLVPFYFLIGAWGGPDRVQATTKLVIYTLVGSLFMLAAAVATGVLAAQSGDPPTFVLTELARVQLPVEAQSWIFAGFAAAFLVKMPLFPVHAWMPDGYRAMPLPVLAVFSAVLSKVAAYGFLRVVLPVLPDASARFDTVLALIALASILYGSVMAFTVTHVRLIVGYSSIAQLGFITLGIFSLRPEGAQGALLQMINHGLVVAPLFFIIGLLAARAGGSEDIRDMGGIAFRAPVLAALFLITALATLAMPGSANFVAEFLILLAAFKSMLVIALIASIGVVLASVYVLRAFIRTMHDPPGEKVVSREIAVADGLVVAPLVAAIVALAFYPQLPLARSEASVAGAVRTAQLIANPAPRPRVVQPLDPGAGRAPAVPSPPPEGTPPP